MSDREILQCAWTVLCLFWPLLLGIGLLGPVFGQINLAIAKHLWAHHRAGLVAAWVAVTGTMGSYGPDVVDWLMQARV